MDPLSQGVVGAVAAQQVVKREHIVAATLLGFLSGLTPDLDVVIRSQSDPLLALEHHRQFSHSLLFIPFGGLFCACLAYFAWFRWRGLKGKSSLSFMQCYLFCTVGVASHGLLDALTTYGTLLLWPFSDARVAWNVISIIDPLFTLPLIVLIVLSIIKKQKCFSIMALSWAMTYIALGIVQRERAEAEAWALAESRGHVVEKLEAKPSFANILVWKTVYTTATHYHVDAVRVVAEATVYPGDKIEKLNIDRDFPWLDASSQQAIDIERFRWFSNGYIALSPNFPNRIIDIRYSLIPNQIRGLWGIDLDPEASADQHVVYEVNRQRDKQTVDTLWAMISGDYDNTVTGSE